MKERRLAAPGAPEQIEIDLSGPGGIEKNEYYLAVSKRFRLARLLMLFLLLFYVLLMVMFFGEDITVSNFNYLFRDINLSGSAGEAFSGVTYSAEPIQRFDIYRGDLVYVTGSEIKLYSATGNTGLHSGLSYETPTVSSGEKYVMIYDLGGRGFSVYNSFSELYRESTEYEMIDAYMADSGDFTVVTRGREYKSIISLYNDDFELVTRYKKKDYVTGTALSDDGETLIMAGVSVTRSSFVTKLSFYKKGGDSEAASAAIVGEYPLRVYSLGERFGVLCTSGVYFYSTAGEKVGEYKFGMTPGMSAASENYVVISEPQNALESRNRIVILDTLGNVLYNKVIDDKIIDISVSDRNTAYLLTGERAIMIDISANAEKTAPVTSSPKKLIASGEETALLCTSSSAVTVDFSSLEKVNKTEVPEF